MKKTFSLILVSILFCFIALGAADKSSVFPHGKLQPAVSRQATFTTYQEKLTSREDRYLYEQIKSALLDRQAGRPNVWIQTDIDFAAYTRAQKEQLLRIYNYVLNDYPELTMFARRTHDIRLAGRAFLLLPSDLGATQAQEVAAAGREILAQCQKMPGLRPEEAVYRYLTRHVRYDRQQGTHSNDVYGALVEHKACCGGISFAYKYLLDRAGASCRVQIGRENPQSELHMWDVVMDNGNVIKYDVTAGLK